MNSALIADLHGRILLYFLRCARCEQETGERIDTILQAGDLGAYPTEADMDRATLRRGRLDATGLASRRISPAITRMWPVLSRARTVP